jgi:alanine or glycine:cation symporter, AGCS family
MDDILSLIQRFDSFLWTYVGVSLIVLSGLYFSFTSGFVQIFGLWRCFRNFFASFGRQSSASARGASPIYVFFASLGGCIGIGNVVAIAVAVQIGGPGALVWVWIAALLGMIIKYAEVYLGIKFRLENDSGSYDGGPMYFLRYAFPKFPIIADIMALLMCIYGAEIYLFGVIKESFVLNFSWPPTLVVIVLLAFVLLTVLGGVRRVGAVNSWLVPIFMTVFLAMVGYVLVINAQQIPAMFKTIILSAFSGHAAFGGFAGSTLILTMSRGISSACYSGDVGIGYASIIHAETNVNEPEKQASLAIVGIFLDTIVVCTAVMLLIMISGVWENASLPGSMLVQRALEIYFPYMNIFMPIFIFMLGFSTITAYLVAGIKSARFLSPKNGKKIFVLVASFAFVFFSFYDPSIAMAIMYSSGGLLMVINIPGIFMLRRYIRYNF